MLNTHNLCCHFGGFKALDNVSITIQCGTITGLIGPNGAGKTTLFNTILGEVSPTSGKVFLNDKDITNSPPHTLFYYGIARTFQVAQIFESLSVLENLMVAFPHQSGENLFNACFHPGKIAVQEAGIAKKAQEILEFLTLDHLCHEKASVLSGGQRKILELGRTMMNDNAIVFLDEVGAGVNRVLLDTISNVILHLNHVRGRTFFITEHDIDFVSKLCDPVIVMAEGKVLTQGKMDDIRNDPKVVDAYFGSTQSTA